VTLARIIANGSQRSCSFALCLSLKKLCQMPRADCSETASFIADVRNGDIALHRSLERRSTRRPKCVD
jgi:hypothetical protein